MMRQERLGAIGEEEPAAGVDSRRLQLLELLEERLRRDHHAVAHHAAHAGVQDPRRDEAQREVTIAELHRVPGVVPALVTDDGVEGWTEKIDDLPLALISPLHTDHDDVGHTAASPCNRAAGGCSAGPPNASMRASAGRLWNHRKSPLKEHLVSPTPRLLLILSSVVASAATGSLPASQVAADLVVRHARIWTGGTGPAATPVPTAEPTALAVRGERLIAVGTDAEIAPLVGPATRVIDAGGRRLLPGFIDSHTHFFSGGESLLGADLRLTASREEFVARFAEYARKIPAGRWITNVTWDHERWPGAPLPTREWIDAAAGDHPVFIARLDGHMALANSRALAAAGITRETKEPERRRDRARPDDRRADRRPQGRRRHGPRLPRHSSTVGRRARRRPRRRPGGGGAARRHLGGRLRQLAGMAAVRRMAGLPEERAPPES